jgi:hypothetical protein
MVQAWGRLERAIPRYTTGVYEIDSSIDRRGFDTRLL